MLKTGILNPHINSLLSRVRHTNTLVIADRGFPSWPAVETIDLSLVDDVPRVLQVLEAVLRNWQCGRIWMAEEFVTSNTADALAAVQLFAGAVPMVWEPHTVFKQRVPGAIGLIRTGDTMQYANMILESA